VLWEATKQARCLVFTLGWWRPGWAYRVFSNVYELPWKSFFRYSWWWSRILSFHIMKMKIAQSEAATGKDYVNYWMHCGGGFASITKKCPKSLGNFFTVRDVLAKFNPEVVRYSYGGLASIVAIDYSDQSLLEARLRWSVFIPTATGCRWEFFSSDFTERFEAAMKDDFNTRGPAVSVLFELVRELNKAKTEDSTKASALAAELRSWAGVLGFIGIKAWVLPTEQVRCQKGWMKRQYRL